MKTKRDLNAPCMKVLIANRGEIACRLITACRSLGLKTVAVYSDVDAGAKHVRMADEAKNIGPGPATESYLNVDRVLEAARSAGANAIHPGYGFLSERAHFAEAVQKAGLTWIGPPAKVIDLMGNKIAAKKAAEKAGVPTLPWALVSEKNVSGAALRTAAQKVGYPLLLKAAAGGGGRGMRLVHQESELEEKAEAASREALGAFGSSEIFLEAYCTDGRHVEVQVFGDASGTVVSLGERECSVQRRHQKVIEEAPAPNLTDKTRKALWKAAVDLARTVGYVNAGTCEFLVDAEEKFYFLEMNTRLQVEHPVTELVWGVDLPALQLQIAMGDKIPAEVIGASPRGHAIEARLYAEDPGNGFMPSPGKLECFEVPAMAHLRVDSGYETGGEVPLFYDAMLAKVIAWGMTREHARRTLDHALSQTNLVGVAWNGPYLRDILGHQKFIDGKVTTAFLGKEFAGWKGLSRSQLPSTETASNSNSPSGTIVSPWFVFGSGTGKLGTKTAAASRHIGHQQDDMELVAGGPLVAEHPGKILKILVKAGQSVKKGDTVVVCESMKMEFSYTAPFDAKVKAVHVEPAQLVASGTVLLDWEDTAS